MTLTITQNIEQLTLTVSDVVRVGGATDHTLLSNIGTLTHDELETAIALNTAKVSYTDAAAVALNTAKVSFPEAPQDGNQYARKNAGWEEVVASGGGTMATTTFTPYSTITSTDGQTAVEELKDELDAAIIGVGAGATPTLKTSTGLETDWTVSTATDTGKWFVNGVKLVEDTDYTRLSNVLTPTGYTPVSGHEWEYYPDIAVPDNGILETDIDTLSKINTVITDATLIDTTDSRLSDARTPTAHTHTASEITDFDTEVANNTAVALNTAKVGVTTEEANTINSEPIGNENQVLQVVSITQANYDLITPVATTFYIIEG